MGKKSDDSRREWQLDLWNDHGFSVKIRPARAEFVQDPTEGESLVIEIDSFVDGEDPLQDGQELPVNCELRVYSRAGDHINQVVIASSIGEKVSMLYDKLANKVTLDGQFTKVYRWGC